MGSIRRLAAIGAVAAGTLGLAAIPVASATPTARTTGSGNTASCVLGNGSGRIKHVIYLQFDNVHLRRDNPNVPSDLEQMPHLLNFLKGNGTVLNKQYTILISHTAGGILSSLTGLYPDRQGVTVSNSYDYYRPNGTPTLHVRLQVLDVTGRRPTDTLPNMVNGDSGDAEDDTCAVGVLHARRVRCRQRFGCQHGAREQLDRPGRRHLERLRQSLARRLRSRPHCGRPTSSASRCTARRCRPSATTVRAHAKDDPLPDEPGGYTGYKALFGAKYVNPAITGGKTAVNDINGNPVTDTAGNPGFPGFDGMTAANTLGYVAQMQESGIPVTFAYISDLHDNHSGGGAYGPGEAGYVIALKTYDDAFAKFFTRLAADGINKSNTLFIVTADENDHFAGQQAQNCDGVHVACTYNTTPGDATGGKPQHGIFDVTNGATATSDPSAWTGPSTWPPAGQNGPLVGEVGYNMKWLLGPTVDGTPYDISFDSAPSFYINGQPQAEDSSGNVVVNPTLRAFEQKAAGLTAFDPYIDATKRTPVARYLVDEPTLKALHMINADPQRNMSFTMFSQPDYFFETFSPCPTGQGCVNDGFAWIHGDYSNDIGQTWLGVVGPGVSDSGIDNRTWTDHADIVPTMDALTGLHPDYTPDGRVITEVLDGTCGQRRSRASPRSS